MRTRSARSRFIWWLGWLAACDGVGETPSAPIEGSFEAVAVTSGGSGASADCVALCQQLDQAGCSVIECESLCGQAEDPTFCGGAAKVLHACWLSEPVPEGQCSPPAPCADELADLLRCLEDARVPSCRDSVTTPFASVSSCTTYTVCGGRQLAETCFCYGGGCVCECTEDGTLVGSCGKDGGFAWEEQCLVHSGCCATVFDFSDG